MEDKMMDMQRAIGCMLGAAYGDSLGAAVEFYPLSTIRARYGPAGIQQCAPFYGQPAGVITDDTQMAMATARGIIHTPTTQRDNDGALISQIWQAYLMWLGTQDDPRECRAPGGTCLSALNSGRKGTMTSPLNDSMGCGGIMRVHPIGVAFAGDPERAFSLGMQSAAITHGHVVNGYVPAGALAMLVALLCSGVSLSQAVESVCARLDALPASQGNDTRSFMQKAWSIAPEEDIDAQIDRVFPTLGHSSAGWLGHDALAIALFAARCADDPIQAVRIAVNHSGDSDSTGSIAGAILGAMHGPEPFLAELAESNVNLEHQDAVIRIGEQLAAKEVDR